MARRFGPTNAPGTVIIERPGEKSIQPGELGVTVLTGITRMGPTADLIPCPTKKEFLSRWCSFKMTDIWGPFDYFEDGT